MEPFREERVRRPYHRVIFLWLREKAWVSRVRKGGHVQGEFRRMTLVSLLYILVFLHRKKAKSLFGQYKDYLGAMNLLLRS